MPHRFQRLFPGGRAGVDSAGNLAVRLRVSKGLYRFYFEAQRGTFDPAPMFFNVNGVRVGPSPQFFRVPGMTDASPKTRHLRESWVCPMVDVYVDRNYIGSALTDFPSHREFRDGLHYGECALGLTGREHEIRFVNGGGYRLVFRKLLFRCDERPPRSHVRLKRELRGQHPRLFFTSDTLHRKVCAGSRRRDFQRALQVRSRELAAGNEPDALDVLPFAFAFLLTRQRKYFVVAQRGMIELLSRQLPGPENGFKMYRNYECTEPGMIIEVASCFYDFCHHEIEPVWRSLIRDLIVRVMRWWMGFIKFNSLEWPGNPGGMGHSAYNYHAVGIAGLTFHGEVPEAQEWLDWAVRHFELAKERTPSDGSLGLFPHEHCFQAYFNFAATLRHATGINQLRDWRFFQRLPETRIRKETSAMEMFPSGYPLDYPPDYITWESLAALTRNPQAQWLAERYRAKARAQASITFTSVRVRNLSRAAAFWRFLHHDPAVPARIDFAKMKTDHLCKESGLAILRSGWFSPDTVHTTLYSGTMWGRKVQDLEYRVSHPDLPAANSIGVYGFGEALLTNAIASYRSHTTYCNTLTIEDDGQIEEGCVFGCRKSVAQCGRIVGFSTGKQFAYAAGEAAQCYEPEVGIKRFTRHLLFLKPHLIVIFDEVELSRPRAAELHFVFCLVPPLCVEKHYRPNRLTLQNSTTAHFAGQRAGLTLVVPQALNLKLRRADCPSARNYTDDRSVYQRITVSAHRARSHRLLTLLLPTKTRQRLPKIQGLSDAKAVSWLIRDGRRELLVRLPRSGRLEVYRKIDGRYERLCGLNDHGTFS